MADALLTLRGMNLRTLYTYRREEIFDKLNDIVQNPGNYLINDAALVEELTRINTALQRLSAPRPRARPHSDYDDGTNADDPLTRDTGKAPAQHIHRTVLPGWFPNRETSSKFVVNEEHQFQFDPRVNVQGEAIFPQRAYWSPYDLLGLFLSKLGPAQPGSNKRNFYLPLIAVYARWCIRVAGKKGERDDGPRGVSNPPFYTSCVWHHDTGMFALGATLEGYDFTFDDQVGQWKTALRVRRWQLLGQFHTFIQARPNFDESATIGRRNDADQANGRGQGNGTHFGNCAETYTYLAILGQRTMSEEDRQRCYGLALQKLYSMEVKAGYDGDRITRKGRGGRAFLGDPCANCKELLGLAGARLGNFKANSQLIP